MRKLLVVLILVLGVALLSAAQGAGEAAVLSLHDIGRGASLGVVAWFIWTLKEIHRKLTIALEVRLPSIEVALWGPLNPKGDHLGGGLIDRVAIHDKREQEGYDDA